jgi:hypothetical protein
MCCNPVDPAEFVAGNKLTVLSGAFSLIYVCFLFCSGIHKTALHCLNSTTDHDLPQLTTSASANWTCEEWHVAVNKHYNRMIFHFLQDIKKKVEAAVAAVNAAGGVGIPFLGTPALVANNAMQQLKLQQQHQW